LIYHLSKVPLESFAFSASTLSGECWEGCTNSKMFIVAVFTDFLVVHDKSQVKICQSDCQRWYTEYSCHHCVQTGVKPTDLLYLAHMWLTLLALLLDLINYCQNISDQGTSTYNYNKPTRSKC